MIDRQGGKIIFECDSCDATFEGQDGDFAPAWAEAKQDGWRAKKIGNEWVHACPACET